MADDPQTEAEMTLVERAPGQAIVLGMATPEECLAVYKLLGPARSYSQIIEYFKQNGRKSPVYETLKKWGAKGKWQFIVDTYDREVMARAEAKAKEEQSREMAEDIAKLSHNYRKVSAKLIRQIEAKIPHLKLQDGTQLKAAAEAAVNLAKAAEVMDGGVSDRTEKVMTMEERKSAASALVSNAFANLRKGNTNNDNGSAQRPMDNAANAGRGAGGVQRDPNVGSKSA